MTKAAKSESKSLKASKVSKASTDAETSPVGKVKSQTLETKSSSSSSASSAAATATAQPSRLSTREKKTPKPIYVPSESLGVAASKEGKDASMIVGPIEIYETKQPLPKRDPQTGNLIFPDYPAFTPNLAPKEVMQKGSFGGTYFRPIYSGITKTHYKDVHREFPSDWFEGLNEKRQVISSTYDTSVNLYKVKSGQDLKAWEESGWISHADPYGWFHWYCRFYLGRRCSDDERQIARAMGVFGPTGRWRRALTNKILAKHGKNFAKGVADHSISPVVRQLLLHWGFELQESHLERAYKEGKF